MSKERGATPPSKETESIHYIVTARYPDDQSSQAPYNETQQLIFDNEHLALSVFRMQFGTHPTSELLWYIAVLGDRPSEEFDQQIRRILSGGQEEALPEEVVAALFERRAHLSALGRQYEGHYRPGFRRRIG